MMPVVFRIPLVNWDIPGYGLALMVGFLLSVIWAVRRAAKSGADPDVVLNCAFIALLGGVGGSRIAYVIHYWDQFAYRGNPLAILFAIIDVRQGGLVVYGGFIAATIGILVYFIFWRHSVRWYLDIIAPSAALGMGLGRIGCFLNGCCWGGVSDLPWAVRFPFGSNAMIQQWQDGNPDMNLPKELICFPPGGIGAEGRPATPMPREVLWVSEEDVAKVQKVQEDFRRATTDEERARAQRQYARLGWCARNTGSITYICDAMRLHGLTLAELRQIARQYYSCPVHPTQPYSTIALVLLALLLNAYYWRRKRDGQVVCLLLLVEPWSRFVLEILRADEEPFFGPFTMAQLTAAPISLIGLLGLIALRYASPRSPRAKLWEPEEERPAAAEKPHRHKPRR